MLDCHIESTVRIQRDGYRIPDMFDHVHRKGKIMISLALSTFMVYDIRKQIFKKRTNREIKKRKSR